MRPSSGVLALRWAGLVAVAVVAVFGWLLFQPLAGDGEGEIVVSIPRGADVGRVGEILDAQGVVSSGLLFEIRARLAGDASRIQSGAYRMRRGMSYASALDALVPDEGERSRLAVLRVTLPEGLSRSEIAPVARQAGIAGDYLRASGSSSALDPRRYGARRARNLDGFLFPATYELRPGASADDLVRRQLREFERRIRGVRMGYARTKNLNLHDVLTIASMVEREVQVPRERRLVAAVIYNRLKARQPLGIDATVRYATGNWSRPLTEEELASRSPYNTRRRAGLPPGPIGNPGLAAIRAAANPARVGYLYYVVKPGTCGEHEFARTDAGFQRAVERYNRARERAGGRSPTRC